MTSNMIKKEIYYYNNEGRRVEFHEEVVDNIKYQMSVSSNIVDQSLINEKWINYGNFLEENTEEGKNLYWSIGKKTII